MGSKFQWLSMKKILTISALIATALMLATPLGVGAVVSDFHYHPSLSYVQLGPATTLPQGLPLCKSASLGNIVCYSPSFIKKAYEVASTSSGNAINDAETAAIAAYPGAIFSQSFGIPEIFLTGNGNPGQVSQAQANYANGVAKGDTFFASAGDTGADFGFGVPMSNFPGSDLHNTAVTGTQGLPYNATGTLTPCPTSTPFSCTSGLSAYHGPCVLGRTIPPNCVPDGYGGEQVWNEPSFGAATGGAPSLLFGVPSYQAGLGLSARGPDVDYNAAIDGGVLVVYGGFGSPVLFIVGGTSAGSPQWAGITALVNQARANAGKSPIGDLNPALYAIYHSARYATDFHDITVGNDQLVGSSVGFSSGTGYDVASGVGSPVVDQLIVDLAAA